MFDFTAIKHAIINDLKPTLINNYLILNEINTLPKELINIIINFSFEISDEMITLKEEIILSEKCSLYRLIDICYDPFKFDQLNNYICIDILSPEYNKYLILNISNLHHQPLINAFKTYKSLIRKCVKDLYSVNNNIFDILFKRYCKQKDSTSYINNFKEKLRSFQRKIKLPEKYSSLLSVKTEF